VRARLRAFGLLGLFGAGAVLTAVLSGLATAAGTYGLRFDAVIRAMALVLSVAANCLLVLLAFRALTVRPVTFREALPGAILAALAWQALLSLAAFFFRTGLMGSSRVYGVFGVVLGLLAWLYLEAVIVVLGAELNVVLARHLWPRSLLTPFVEDADLTNADRRSYTSYADAQQYTESQSITVEFDEKRDRDRENCVDPPGQAGRLDESGI
jgi:uncharacterized BrkB/YihY/UPF0761 family membrane protein